MGLGFSSEKLTGIPVNLQDSLGQGIQILIMNDKHRLLTDVIDSSETVQQQWRQLFNDPANTGNEILSRGCTIAWYYHEKLALRSLFLENDIAGAKQHYYTCGRLDEYQMVHHDARILDYGINHLSYVLLSDNPFLIERYANLKHSNYEKMIQGGGTAPSAVLQSLIKDDWNEYERVMPIVKTKSVKKFNMDLDASFYEAVAERNKARCEEILAEFVSSGMHKRRNKLHTIVNDFISHPALGYAKLAWLKGLEVSVGSPLVPIALLPVQPLESYPEAYGFLQHDKQERGLA